jgi:hypothetical protein
MHRITGNSVSILSEHDISALISNEISQSLETRTIVEIGTRCLILELSYDLVGILLAVLP